MSVGSELETLMIVKIFGKKIEEWEITYAS